MKDGLSNLRLTALVLRVWSARALLSGSQDDLLQALVRCLPVIVQSTIEGLYPFFAKRVRVPGMSWSSN